MRGVKSQPHGATHQPFVGVRSELADWVRSLLLKDAGVVSLSSPLQCCLPHSIHSRDENGYHHVVMSKRMKNYDDKDNHKK